MAENLLNMWQALGSIPSTAPKQYGVPVSPMDPSVIAIFIVYLGLLNIMDLILLKFSYQLVVLWILAFCHICENVV